MNKKTFSKTLTDLPFEQISNADAANQKTGFVNATNQQIQLRQDIAADNH